MIRLYARISKKILNSSGLYGQKPFDEFFNYSKQETTIEKEQIFNEISIEN